MEQVFSYIISLGAPVMMPILFTVIGLCIGMKFAEAFKSGLFVGVGFIGLGVVTALLTTNFNDPLKGISDIYHLQLNVFDMGWPAAAAVAYNTAIGALIIPICLGVNVLMLLTKTTRTVNIDLWNYWHFAFIGAVVYFVMGESLLWGYFAAIVCYIITLVCADLTAEKFQKFYDLDGISIPQPFCQSFMPFAIVLDKLLGYIPGFSKLDVDAEGMKKKFGILGEPLVLGVVVGMLIGWAAQLDIKRVLSLGVIMGAVMELIPRITSLFIEGLKPISEKTQELVKKRFNGKKVYIGMSPALVIGHPTTLVVSVVLIPVILALAVFLPGNQFLPLASLAGMFYLFPIVLPFTKGNVVRTLVVGLVALVVGLYFVTDMAPDFTMAANAVYKATGDATAHIPDGFSGGALDFASSLFGWAIYKLSCHVEYVGPAILVVLTVALMLYNRRRITITSNPSQVEEGLYNNVNNMKKIFISAAVAIMSMSAMAQTTNYNVRWANHPEDAKHYTTERLRKEFLIEKVFAPGEVNWTYSMYDRFLIGGAQPVAGTPIALKPIEPLLAKTLLENREIGIINVGGPGTVVVDGKSYDLGFEEGLYVGRSTEKSPNNITLVSKDAANPAKFYMNSATAHTSYPTKRVTLKEANNIKAGSLAESNDRVIHQLIIDGVAGVRTCQLQMGVTELKTGSVWNTMPAHTHLRRMETYLYFNVPEGQRICHIMGEPQETRPMWMNNEQAVISPQWSIHCAAGTSNYTFIWGMAGENLNYKDMQVVKTTDLK